MKKWTGIMLAMLLSHASYAQIMDTAKLSRYFDTLAAHNKFMGSAAMGKNGKVIFTRSVGFSDVENNVKTQENTKFRIGSISKTFTAALVLKAVEEKKLTLSQTIEKYFPAIPNAEEITVGNLLNHRSGIPNFTSNAGYLSWHTLPKNEKEMVDTIAKQGSDFAPGSTGAYSNSNYVLLTFILQKTYNVPYSHLLKKYITQPLGLHNTYAGGKINQHNREAFSYYFNNKWIKAPETDASIPLGAGAIVSTPQDLIKFGEALFAGKIISLQSVEMMKTMRDGYGMGLFELPFYEKKGFGHTGGIDGFSSMWGFFPEDKISFAFVSNGSNINTNDIAIAMLSTAYNRPYNIPEYSFFEVSADELEKYTGVYASAQMPLKITVFTENGRLMAQATGQSSFPLEAKEKDVFSFDAAQIVIEFNPEKKTLLLKQGGGEFAFSKE